MQLILNHLR